MKPNAVEEYKALGDLYLQQNKKDQAIAAYKKYLEKDSSNGGLVMSVADFEYKANDFDESQSVSEHGTRRTGAKTVVSLTVWSGLLPEQELHEVSGDFQTIGSAYPQNADVFKTLFDISMKNGSTADAIGALKKYAANQTRRCRGAETARRFSV